MTTPVAGLLLAAGAGRRMGRPKGLVTTNGTPWVRRGVQVLRSGGCSPLVVTVGAQGAEVAALVADEPDVTTVQVPDWQDGMGASLRAGLRTLLAEGVERVLIHLVDLVDVEADVIARVIERGGSGADALARAAYDEVPGHPVLLGQQHLAGVFDSATGDRGARGYLRAHSPRLVECGDLATGRDADRPEDLPAELSPDAPSDVGSSD